MPKKKFLYAALVIFILFFGVFIRFWKLDSIPPGMQYDEAFNGLNALQAIETGNYKVFYPENYGREAFHINVESIFIRNFGAESFALRMTNGIWGSLTLLGFFLLLRRLKFSPLATILGTFMITFSFWHLNFSRTCYRAIMVPLLITWLSYFFFQGFYSEKKKWLFFMLSGALTGLGLHTYIAFRVAPLIVIFVVIALFLSQKDFIKQYHRLAIIYIVSALVVALPILVYFYQHPTDFSGRSEAVSVFNAPNMKFPQAFTTSLLAHLQSFYLVGDTNPRHNYPGQPTIPVAWSILFSLGFIISLKEIIVYLTKRIQAKIKKQPELPAVTQLLYPSILGQSIFWIMLIPGVLSIEGIPHALRMIGAIPGVFLLCIIPFEYVLNLYKHIQKSRTFNLKPWRWNILRASLLGIIVIVILSGFSQVNTYFNIWSKDPRVLGAFERKQFDLGRLIKQLPTKQHNYLITGRTTWINQERKESSLRTVMYMGYPKIKQYLFYQPLEGRFAVECNDTQILLLESDQWLRDQFKQRCPNLQAKEQTVENGIYQYWVLQSE